MISYSFTFVVALENEKAYILLFFLPQIALIWSLKYSNKVLLKVRLKTLWHQKHHFCYWPFITVPDIPITNRESGIMTRALPTPTEKGIFFFHQSETYELICNYASCWWITHPHQRTVDRNHWPVAMYISDAFTDNICKECGNNTYINLISNMTFWHIM